MTVLEPALTADFARDGFLHLRGFFSGDEVDELQQAIDRTSGARAGQSSLDDGEMTFYSLLFPMSTDLQAFVGQPRLVELACALLDDDAWVRWDQAVVKRAGAPEFPWHQDNGYSLLRSPHVQAWVALTDAGPEDGGLWVVPGSHHRDLAHHDRGAHVEVDDQPTDGVAVRAGRGDLVLFSSRLLHRTTPNRSGRDRLTYVIEYLGVHALDPYVAPPYFVVSRERVPSSCFRRWIPGRRSPVQQLRYLPDRLRVRRREGTWHRGL
ncbi:MAG TPA: phytanoyl-CoA dioxygenase family protein [Acidimicrobiales bacterium]|nr:phytanoyl-CoA dioxygenase family protein [Acidimicrobiales bacterium]